MAILQNGPKVTLEDIRKSIDRMILEKKVGKSATILWATTVYKGDEYNQKWGIMPASVLLGLEWEENGVHHAGTLKIEPPIENRYLN